MSLSLHVRIIFHFVIHDVPKVFTAVTYREDLTCQVKYRKQVAVETQHCPPSWLDGASIDKSPLSPPNPIAYTEGRGQTVAPVKQMDSSAATLGLASLRYSAVMLSILQALL